MNIKFYGTRGSIPTPHANFLAYGGNTSCVTVHTDNQLYIIDAGTGIRSLGKELLNTSVKKINILFTHFHLDHIQGLPFFDPAYHPDFEIHLYALSSRVKILEKVICDYMNQYLFPIRFTDLKATITFNAIEKLPLDIIDLNHPGECIGFKFRSKSGKTLGYLVDHELRLPIDQDTAQNTFCQGLDLLVHDGQYTKAQYFHYQGWGHSCIEHVVTLADALDIKQLILTHHDPNSCDKQLSEYENLYRKTFNNLLFAKESMEVTL